MNNKPNKSDLLIIIIVLVLGTALRCYHLNAPLTDLHSWNQASAATVIRDLKRHPGHFLSPQWQVLDHGSRGPKYGAEETPIYHLIAALAAPSAQPAAIVLAGRLTSIAFGLLAAVVMWRLVRRRWGFVAAHAAVMVFYLSPIALFFGRSVATDTMSLALGLLALERTDAFLAGGAVRDGLFGILSMTLAALAKPYNLVLLLPLTYLYYEKQGFSFFKNLMYGLLISLPVLTAALWIRHAAHLGSLGGAWSESDALWTNQLFGPFKLMLAGRYWNTLAQRLWHELLTPVPACLALGGCLLMFIPKFNKHSFLLHSWLASALAYLCIVRQGNLIHNYYQYLLLPPLAVLAGWTLEQVLNLSGDRRRRSFIAFGLLMLGMAYFGTAYFFQYHRYDLSDPLAAELIRQHTRPEERIMVWESDRDRKPQLFFYADREGWFFRGFNAADFARHIDLGARLMVNNLPVHYYRHLPREALDLIGRYPLIAQAYSVGRFGEKRIIQIRDLAGSAPNNQAGP